MAASRLCSIHDCGKPATRRDMCNAHYRRLLKHGDATAGRTMRGALTEFFEGAVAFTGSDCLIWPYGHTDRGYGLMYRDGKHVLVHREVCEAAHGKAPSPLHEAAHLCGKGHAGCCNPRHLAWKTTEQNEADKILHGTIARGTRQAFSKLTDDQVREIRSTRTAAKALASRFSVSEFTIYKIRRGDSWAWLK